MERSNQPPKTECCREQGQVPEATEASGPNDLLEAYTGKLTVHARRTNGRFDFLGFEFYWRLSRRGRPLVQRRTARGRMRKSVAVFTEWIRRSRHRKLPETMQTLARKYRGYWNYYGVRGNFKSLGQFFQQTRRILHKWLNRRSQRKSYTALGFERLLRRFQIPHPRIVEIVEKEPVPIRRDPVGVEAALDVLFGRNNHPPSRA